jgi:hypothetical protein
MGAAARELVELPGRRPPHRLMAMVDRPDLAPALLQEFTFSPCSFDAWSTEVLRQHDAAERLLSRDAIEEIAILRDIAEVSVACVEVDHARQRRYAQRRQQTHIETVSELSGQRAINLERACRDRHLASSHAARQDRSHRRPGASSAAASASPVATAAASQDPSKGRHPRGKRPKPNKRRGSWAFRVWSGWHAPRNRDGSFMKNVSREYFAASPRLAPSAQGGRPNRRRAFSPCWPCRSHRAPPRSVSPLLPRSP